MRNKIIEFIKKYIFSKDAKSKIVYLQLIIIGFILGFIPLIYDSSVYLMFELPKIIYFRIGVLILLILEIGKSIQISEEIGSKKLFIINFPKFSRRSYFFIFTLFFILLVSTVFSPNIYAAFWGNFDKRFGLYTILYFLIFGWLTTSIIKENKDLAWKIFSVLLPVPIVTNFIICLAQVSGTIYDLSVSEGRAYGTFGQPNFLAGFVLLSIPILIYLGQNQEKLFSKIFNWVFVAMGLIVIILTQSRMGMVVSIIMIGAYVLYFLLNNSFFRKYSKAILTSGAVITLVCLFLLFSFGQRFIQNGLIDQTRIEIWKSSIDLINRKPLIGYGFDVSGYIFPTAMYENGINTSIALDRAHNEYLDLAISGGIPLLVLVLVGSGILILKLWKNFERKKYDLYNFTLLIALSAFLFRSISGENGIVSYIYIIFFLGLIIIEIQPHKIIMKFKFDMLRGFMIVSSIILFGGLIYININELKADRSYKVFTNDWNLPDIIDAVNFAPWELRYRIEYLDELVRDEENFKFETVIPKSMATQKLMPAEYYFRVGKYYLLVGDGASAKNNFRKAVMLAPTRRVYIEALEETK